MNSNEKCRSLICKTFFPHLLLNSVELCDYLHSNRYIELFKFLFINKRHCVWNVLRIHSSFRTIPSRIILTRLPALSTIDTQVVYSIESMAFISDVFSCSYIAEKRTSSQWSSCPFRRP